MLDMDSQISQQKNHQKLFLQNLEPEFLLIYGKHRHRTLHAPEVIYQSYKSAKYICQQGLLGDIVEFGVWKGGVLAIVGETLKLYGGKNRLIGIDTFEGMPKPTEVDKDVWGNSMLVKYKKMQNNCEPWAKASYEDVSSYLSEIYNDVILKKEEINKNSEFSYLKCIAMLRLDMSLFEPTYIALNENYRKIQKNGFLNIVYGHHTGAKLAVDKFIKKSELNIYFANTNYSNIVAII